MIVNHDEDLFSVDPTVDAFEGELICLETDRHPSSRSGARLQQVMCRTAVLNRLSFNFVLWHSICAWLVPRPFVRQTDDDANLALGNQKPGAFVRPQ